MRINRGIKNLLADEHIFAVNPMPAPQVQAGWHKRLNLYPGRALSARALQAEQSRRAGGLSSRGQVHSPGVVTGLEVMRENPALGESLYRVSPGLGLTAGGEDVVVTTETRLDPLALRVVAPAGLLAGLPVENGEVAPAAGADPLRREVGLPLRRFLPGKDNPPPVELPRAAILVLQPVTVELVGFEEQEDICPSGDCGDGLSDASFDDWQLIDGCRLLHFAWPSDVLGYPEPGFALPGGGNPARSQAVGLWRNLLAYTIFEYESRLPAGKGMPWSEFGVAVGLVGFDSDWNPLFVDRNSVVRMGGRPRRRSGYHQPVEITVAKSLRLPGMRLPMNPKFPMEAAGNDYLPVENDPFVWQARMLQFSEQVGDALAAGVAAADLDNHFRFTPPAGMLPRGVLDLAIGDSAAADRVRIDHFFPASYAVDATPAPLEQLDAVFEASASLKPFDSSSPDRVRFVVPVPQSLYDPALLKVERIDPAFDIRIRELVASRNTLLRRRQDVRERQTTLYRAVRGEEPPAPPPEPGAAEDERLDPAAPQPPENEFGTTLRGNTRVALAYERLKEQLSAGTPIKKETITPIVNAPAALLQKIQKNQARFNSITGGRMRFNPAIKSFELRGVLSEEQKKALLKLAPEEPFVNSINRLHSFSQKDDLSRLDELGVERFIEFLQSKVDKADDQVNLGFVRVQTDIYRMQQLMRGLTDATVLATSPALASIARFESAAASKEEVTNFYEALKKRSTTPPAKPPSPPPSPTPAAGGGTAKTASFGKNIFSAGTLASSANLAAFIEPASAGLTMTDVLAAEAKSESGIFIRGGLTASKAATLGEGAATPAKESDVIEQVPLVGASTVRTLNIAERLQAPRAPEAKQFTTSTKYDVISSMMRLDISVEGVEVMGLPDIQDGKAQYDDFGQPLRIGPVKMEDLNPSHLLDEPDPKLNDEAAYFVGAVELADHTIGALRNVEGRIAGYRRAIELCKAALAELRENQQKSDARLQELNTSLLVARHDVAVARALLGDETQRVAEVNSRRDGILRESVRFVAFYRPRNTANIRPVPARTLFPGQVEPSVPECLESNVTTPPDLQRMVDLFRRAPLEWFTHMPHLLNRLDRLDDLQNFLQESIVNTGVLAQLKPVTKTALTAQQSSATITPGMLTESISKVFQAQSFSLDNARTAIASLDVSRVVRGSWQDVRKVAERALTLGDLIEGRHTRSDLRNLATRELNQIDSIATCLYSAFSRLRPALRMAWALDLSQYDQAIDLRDLGRLSRWGDVDFLERRAMQEMVEWLYGRINVDNAQAHGMMNDLVRVCLLEASHAPVRGIVSGYLPRDLPIRPGLLVDLKAYDLAQLRVGMKAHFFRGDEVVAEADVEDLNSDGPAVRVTTVKVADATGKPLDQVNLATGARVHFLG